MEREMNNSQFAQERHQQHFGAPPTSQQQNGQFNTPSNNLSSHNHTEGHLNDQFSQLGLNNVPLLSPVQNNALSSNINSFPAGPQANIPQGYPPTNFIAEHTGLPKQFSSVPYGGPSNQNVPSSNSFQEKSNDVVPFPPYSDNSIQSKLQDGISNQQFNQESREFINGTPGNSNEANMSSKHNEFSTSNSNSVQNQFVPVLNSLPQHGTGFPSTLNSSSQFSQQSQSAFSVVPPQSRSQRAYPNTTGLSSHIQQPQLIPSFPSLPPNSFPTGTSNTNQTQSISSTGFSNTKLQQNGSKVDTPSHSQLREQNQFTANSVDAKPNSYEKSGPPQSGLLPQQLGPSEHLSSVSQNSGFAPQQQLNALSQPSSSPQILDFPPTQSDATIQKTVHQSQPSSFPSQQSKMLPQQSGLPPQQLKMSSQLPGFLPQSNIAPQQPGFPPQSNMTLQQPSFPLQSNMASQKSSFPSQLNLTPQQSSLPPQPNLVPQQQLGFPPQSQPNLTPQQPGFPSQPNLTPQQPGFPPQQPSFPPQQPGFPHQQSNLQSPSNSVSHNSSTQNPGFPPQQNLMSQPSFAPKQPQQQEFSPQQPILPPQQPGLPLSQPGFPPQANNLPLQQSGYLQQQQGIPPQQSGFPPQANNIPSQQSGYLQQQQGVPPQQPGFPPQPLGLPPQQQSFPPQSGNLPPRQVGFPTQSLNSTPQQSGYLQQQGGFNPQQPGFAQGTPSYMGQPAPSRRLDPDQMPSPVQVIQDDQQSKGGIFLTNQRGLVPPLVTTDFTVQDGGNASPRLIRSTMYCVPTTTDIMKQTSVPFGLVISPMAKIKPDEYPPPIINTGEVGPVRCKRCKAYMSPFMQFIDGGKHFVCLLCKASTEVPVEYFQHLDHTGQRLDRSERPELCFGSYEFIVPKEYCRKEMQPKPPAYIFVIDVSYNNIKSGLVQLVCAFMKELLTQLPTELGEEKSKIRVGFITYDTTVHFYNIKETLAIPQMMVVGDTTEMFMPLLDGFLCNPEKSSHVIDALMEQIPTQFNETRTTETVLLPAIKAGMEALKNADCCGKLFVFHSSLPIAEAPGKLKNREDRKLLATDKEKSILNPQTNVYKELGEECVQVGCSVDLFITNNSYIDLATIGQISKISGGEIFKYTYFQAEFDGQRFLSDLKHDISRPTVFDAVMRVRTSTGTRPTDFYGHFFMSNSTDVELAAIDCDKAIAIEVKHDDKLDEQDGVMVQTAMLYTSCSGQRRVRILNLSLRSSGQMGELYRSCDLDTIMNFFGKQVMYKILESSGRQVKEAITNKAAQILATYRKHCASPSSAGQLILPECMKLMPLYVNCLIKSDAMSGGPDMTVDDRWYNMHLVITSDVPTTLGYFYPRLIPIHTLAEEISLDDVSIPDQLRCSIEKFSENGAYILENGVYMFLWLGMGLSQAFLADVFGVQNIAQVDTERSAVPVINNPLNKAVHHILSKIQKERSHTMRLSIVRQRDKIETVMRHFLVEDHGVDNSQSYVEFLCHMHKEIRNLLS